MESLAVDLQLLRSMIVGDLRLSVGRMLAARVASVDGGGRGTISLAGALLDAELPAGLVPGQEIHLQVRELTPEKVVLALQERPPVLDQPVTTPMPGGGMLEVRERSGSASGGGSGEGAPTHTVTLVYEAPSLGAVEMRFVLDPTSLRLELQLSAGDPYERAQDVSDELRAALSAAVQRTITVSVLPRHDPVEIYA
ncbi:MAG: hypothetical protein ACLP0J_20700 [Solirubrobacteraceae bacterium]